MSVDIAAHAQKRQIIVGLQGGSGLALGTGQGGVEEGDSTRSSLTLRRAPIFLEGEFRMWSSEQPDPVYGAALRLELDGRVSAAIVPRLQIHREIGPMKLRVLAGIPFFFVPFSLLGAEFGSGVLLPLGSQFSLAANFFVDVFFWGKRSPKGQCIGSV